MHLVLENGYRALFQPEAVAQNSQAFIVPVTGSLLKRFGWGMDQAVGQFPG